MIKRPRNKRIPSTSHQIVALALKERAKIKGPHSVERNAEMAGRLRAMLSATVCGADCTEWIFQQLATLPDVVERGWPTPPMQKMRRRNRSRY
jgi:hypothetical protein